MRNNRYEIYCPACYKLKVVGEEGGIHCDACVGLIIEGMNVSWVKDTT